MTCWDFDKSKYHIRNAEVVTEYIRENPFSSPEEIGITFRWNLIYVDALLRHLTDRKIIKENPRTYEIVKCDYDPEPLKGVPLGMFHCPKCRTMVIAGLPH